MREGRLRHDRINERNAHLNGGRHAGPVGISQVQAGQEEPGVCQAHPVDLVTESVVVIDLTVLPDDLVNVTAEFSAAPGTKLSGVITGVAAAEPWLLLQVS